MAELGPIITIKPCSWATMSGLLSEWQRYLKDEGGMSVERAMTIAGHALAVAAAAAQGRKLPADWRHCHPSLPRQMERHFEAITAHPIVTGANMRPDFFIEFD